jgi:predicted 3-demethylubiquinone-9 3-methyltransferase (glyoxalase superfamily)
LVAVHQIRFGHQFHGFLAEIASLRSTPIVVDFKLDGQPFAAMDSALEHGFSFNEAISFYVECDDQAEVDHFWEKLSAVPEAEQCGWLKDKYGVSWQIVPKQLGEFLSAPDREKADRAMQAMLKMKKIDIAQLKVAFDG